MQTLDYIVVHPLDTKQLYFPSEARIVKRGDKYRCRVVIDNVVFIHPLEFTDVFSAAAFLAITMIEGCHVA